MTTFLHFYFFISVLVFAFLLWRFLKDKPTRQKLHEKEAELKVQETINELLKKELPASTVDKLRRFNELRRADK